MIKHLLFVSIRAVLIALLPLAVITAAVDDDSAAWQTLLQRSLEKQLTLELQIAENISWTQSIEFTTRMIARQSDGKPTRAAKKYWDTIFKSPRYDAVHGGFFSFAQDNQDRSQTKKLLEQALVAEVLLDAVQISGDDRYRDAVQKILAYVLHDLRFSTGGFATSAVANPEREGQEKSADQAINPAINGLMVAAFARGYALFGNQDYYTTAVQTQDLLLTHCVTAIDYMSVIYGALALYQVTGEARWLAAAITLQDRMDREFWDKTTAGYRILEPSHIPKELEIMNLSRLVTITDDDSFRDRANSLVETAITQAGDNIMQNPGLLCALDQHLGPRPHLSIVGDPNHADTRSLLTAAHRSYQPRLVIVTYAGDPVQAELRKRFPAMVPTPKVSGKSTAYLCIDMMCNAPVTNPIELEQQLSALSYKWLK